MTLGQSYDEPNTNWVTLKNMVKTTYTVQVVFTKSFKAEPNDNKI